MCRLCAQEITNPDGRNIQGEVGKNQEAHACTILNVPFLIVRSASDSANGESPVKFEEFLPTASENAAIITRTVLESI